MSTDRDAVLVIADISGYTRFLISHGKAQAHGDMVVGALLEAIMAEVELSLEVVELEGDAVFMYADRAKYSPKILGGIVQRVMQAFTAAVEELHHAMICRCPACANVQELRLKLIVHAGHAVSSQRGRFTRLSGTDVIIVHRLLKNRVEADEYVLLTEAARREVELPDTVEFQRWTESYDDIGEVSAVVATDISRLTQWNDGKLQSSATSSAGFEILRKEIRTEYGEVASKPTKGFHFHTGRPLAERLGYQPGEIAAVPESSLESFAGTGNPLSMAVLPSGATVVDIGCGAGFDTMIAAFRVGARGRVIGIDMTEEMLARARSSVEQSGYAHVEIREGYAESLPVADECADFVISNGVFNLCPDKPRALAEMQRVLKPGGRILIGDIVVQKPVPEAARGNIDLWTG